MKTRPLFIVTAVIETGAGLAFALSPSVPVALLLGSSLNLPGLIVGHLTGVALLSLGAACWVMRNEKQSRPARALLTCMLFYNSAAAALLAYAALSRLFGIALWPAVVLHIVMALWCLHLRRPQPM